MGRCSQAPLLTGRSIVCLAVVHIFALYAQTRIFFVYIERVSVGSLAAAHGVMTQVGFLAW
jgi:hypothetical protein